VKVFMVMHASAGKQEAVPTPKLVSPTVDGGRERAVQSVDRLIDLSMVMRRWNPGARWHWGEAL
jgi:hypothetical protein